VALVEAHDLIGRVAIRDHYQRAIGESEFEILIPRVEISD
jgi:hypothetical protein